jgi:hypothetical protein
METLASMAGLRGFWAIDVDRRDPIMGAAFSN